MMATESPVNKYILRSLKHVDGITAPTTREQKKNYFNSIRTETRRYAYLCMYIHCYINSTDVSPHACKYIFLQLKSIASDLLFAVDATTAQVYDRSKQGIPSNIIQEVNLITLIALHRRMVEYISMLYSISGSTK